MIKNIFSSLLLAVSFSAHSQEIHFSALTGITKNIAHFSDRFQGKGNRQQGFRLETPNPGFYLGVDSKVMFAKGWGLGLGAKYVRKSYFQVLDQFYTPVLGSLYYQKMYNIFEIPLTFYWQPKLMNENHKLLFSLGYAAGLPISYNDDFGGRLISQFGSVFPEINSYANAPAPKMQNSVQLGISQMLRLKNKKWIEVSGTWNMGISSSEIIPIVITVQQKDYISNVSARLSYIGFGVNYVFSSTKFAKVE